MKQNPYQSPNSEIEDLEDTNYPTIKVMFGLGITLYLLTFVALLLADVYDGYTLKIIMVNIFVSTLFFVMPFGLICSTLFLKKYYDNARDIILFFIVSFFVLFLFLLAFLCCSEIYFFNSKLSIVEIVIHKGFKYPLWVSGAFSFVIAITAKLYLPQEF